MKKSDLPSKICSSCQRPFVWRKKWERCWDEVKYCSERCRSQKIKAENAPVNIAMLPIENRKSLNRKS